MPERLPDYVSEAFMPHPPKVMGVAVSGGSDSMALLHLLHEFCQLHTIKLYAVTVDHNLRAGSAEEAAQVERHCASLGVPHDTLVWQDWSGRGNLQDAARSARYAQMADWAQQYDINTIAVGHTADDQAETVLMRMARRAGVDGLAGMSHRTVRDGITWVRPLLRSRRKALRDYLIDHKVAWINDPSNEDDRFDRIKARKALGLLADLGIDADVLSEVADHLGQARRALSWQTFLSAKQNVQIDAGALMIDELGLRLLPDEIQRRLMIHALGWVAGSTYPPRRTAVAHLLRALIKGQAGTLDGCHIRRIAARIWIFREFSAVEDHVTPVGGLWDGRWQATAQMGADEGEGLELRALGLDGLKQCPDWRQTGRPHVVLQSTPSIWRGPTLVSAPYAGYAQNWEISLKGGPESFFAALLSH